MFWEKLTVVLTKVGKAIANEVAMLPIKKWKAGVVAVIGLLCGGDAFFFSPYREMSFFFFAPGALFYLIFLAKDKRDERIKRHAEQALLHAPVIQQAIEITETNDLFVPGDLNK